MQSLVFMLSMVRLLTMVLSASTVSYLPYPLEVAQYSGTHGGHEVQLNGTIQEVMAQMTALFPDFNPASVTASVAHNNLTSRATDNKNGLLCIPVAGQNWRRAYAGDIQAAVDALLVAGKIGVNGRSCISFSCVGSCGFFLCNDNNHFINPSMAYLVTYAEDIFNRCKTIQDDEIYAGGQEFDSNDYNVIVRQEAC